MTNSKTNDSKNTAGSLLDAILFILVGVLIIGLIRRTWKAILFCLILGIITIYFFPSLFLNDIVSAERTMDISDNETMQSLIPQQIGMAAGMFYAIYLFYLLITGRLIETLIGSRFERSMRDAEKVVNDDPGMKDQLKKFSQDSQKLNQDMDDFCRKYPDSPLCKSSGKSSITDVEY